ncbi:MAG: MFS transporter, partial [Paracoccaceae bacterium]
MTSENKQASVSFMATLVLLAALPLLSLNMFLPSLGVMAEEFKVGYDAMALTISTYLLFTAVIQLIAGPVADRYGRRPVVVFGLMIFCISSLGCALAQSYEAFFFWRAVQGAVAIAGVLSRAIVGDVFSPQRSASVLGYIA